jgi:cell wall-associated NlpC family hydrolase
MRTTRTNRRRARALARPLGVLAVCAIALPQAIARSSESASTPGAANTRDAARDLTAHTADGRFLRRVALHTSRRLRQRAAAHARLLPPLVVRRVIAAGDRIATAPYSYGGGHGNWDAGAYDCSGSVSYALHGGGLIDVALDSSQLMSWGDPGPGRWITIYANPGHAYMTVGGRRFDTTGREETGSRWQSELRDTSGYAVRHPRGL